MRWLDDISLTVEEQPLPQDGSAWQADDVPTLGTIAAPVNRLLTPLVTSRRWNVLVRRWLTTATYTGRRSGRTITTPVGFRRTAPGVVEIGVMAPDRKTWWRNFTGEGAPLTLVLDRTPVTGHAVATSDGGRVRVTVRLDRP